jgi:hypothetical protein
MHSSNSTPSIPNSSNLKSFHRKRPTASRLPLTLTAIVAVLVLTVPADAGWFGGRGFGGGGFGGFRGFAGHGGGARGMRVVRPGNNSGRWGRGTEISDGGRSTFKSVRGNRQSIDGGSRVSDSSRSDGEDRPRGHRYPRIPSRIVSKTPVIVPSVVTVVTAASPARSAVHPRVDRSNGGSGGGNAAQGGKSTGGRSTAGRAGNGVPPAGERRYVPDEVLIQLASTVPTTSVDALARRMRLDRLESFDADGITMFHWRIPDQRSVPAVIRSLEAERIAAQPNYLYLLQEQRASNDRTQAAVSPSEGDPDQYALVKLRLPQAHALAKGDNVLIAVIDSGVDTSHPELAGMVSDSYDALSSDEKPHAHGTGVAGAIVAHARLMGAAPKARILAIRAFGRKESNAEATTYGVNKGLVWAMAHGARVINMSFTGPRDPSIAHKIAQARGRGIVLIAAAGNAGPKSEPLYPAAYSDVIAVTATDADDQLLPGANRGRHIAVAAPGVDLLLPAPESGYQVTTGTSRPR